MVVKEAEARDPVGIGRDHGLQQGVRVALALGQGDAEQLVAVGAADEVGVEGLAEQRQVGQPGQIGLEKVRPGPHLGQDHEMAEGPLPVVLRHGPRPAPGDRLPADKV